MRRAYLEFSVLVKLVMNGGEMELNEKMRGTVKFVNELGKDCEYFGTIKNDGQFIYGSSTRQHGSWLICETQQVVEFEPANKSLTESS